MASYPIPELIAPPFPISGHQVWEWFLALHGSRQNGFAFSAITYVEMTAFFALRNERPTQWELDVIRRLDAIAAKHQAKGAK